MGSGLDSLGMVGLIFLENMSIGDDSSFQTVCVKIKIFNSVLGFLSEFFFIVSSLC